MRRVVSSCASSIGRGGCTTNIRPERLSLLLVKNISICFTHHISWGLRHCQAKNLAVFAGHQLSSLDEIRRPESGVLYLLQCVERLNQNELELVVSVSQMLCSNNSTAGQIVWHIDNTF
jgi:hypothetical protein